MTITLTRFNVNPRSYSNEDTYKGVFMPDEENRHWDIEAHLLGLLKHMATFTDEPAAWSFSEWKGKGSNNTKDNWIAATAVVLEYRGKDLAQVASELHTRATELGYAHLLMDSLSRKGEKTITIIFPLTESINKDQYARLASVLSEELGQYRAAEGNMAATHLVHVDKDCSVAALAGAIISPRHKIKETEKLYQSMDPRRFEAGGPAAAVQIVAPVVTHDGLFDWGTQPETAGEVMERLGATL